MKGKLSGVIVGAVCVFTAICAGGLYFATHGLTLGAEVKLNDSDYFSQDDINTAAKLVMQSFRQNFDGCIMRTLTNRTKPDTESSSDYAGEIILTAEYQPFPPFAAPELGSSISECSFTVSRDTNGLWVVRALGHNNQS